MKLTIHRSNGKLKIRTLFTGILVFWPIFYTLWSQIRGMSGFIGNIPLILLALTALLSAILYGKLRTSILLWWLVFYAVTLMTSYKASRSVYMLDTIVSFSCWLICYTLGKSDVDAARISRWLIGIAIFAIATIYIEAVTKIFSLTLSGIFQKAPRVGIFSYTGFAGGIFIPGFLAYLVSYTDKRKKAIFWVMTGVFVFGLLLIKKRGFIVDVGIALVFVYIVSRLAVRTTKIKLNKLVWGIVITVVLIAAIYALYTFVPFINQTVNNITSRFADEDGDFSGRTSLYELALKLFRTNPLFGIGWGNFRAHTLGVFRVGNTATFETHNVYLQLLCENGIVGLSGFIIAVGSVLIYTIMKYAKTLKTYGVTTATKAYKLSLYIQLFFLTYCMSGNPLYDYIFVVIYFTGVFLLGVNEREPQ